MIHRASQGLRLLIVLVGTGFGLGAEELPALPAEAPTSIFAAKGPAGAGELLASGSWDLSLLSSATLGIPGGGGLTLNQVQPLLFKQTPDLLLSFLYDERWYAEARVSPDGGQSRFAAGFRGGEGETLREVRIGNSGIGLPSLPFVTLGEGGAYSLGGLVKAKSGAFEASALLRYDQADRVRRVFRGSTEISETIIPIASFMRGRWFLAGAGPITNLRLYVESQAGTAVAADGSRWRALTAEEYRLVGSGGYVELDKAATGRIAATWSELAAGDLLFGASKAALFYDPLGIPSSYEVLSKYSLAGDVGEIFVRDRASGDKAAGYEALAGKDGIVEIVRSSALAPDPRPFAAAVPDLYARKPDETSGLFAALPAFEIVATRLSGGSSITIEKDVIAGSIEVRRNGLEDAAFAFDPVQGSLSLSRPPEATETIEVSYLRQSAERKAGSITGGLVGLYRGDAGLSAWTALVGHVGIPGQGYAEEGRSDPARLSFVVGSEKAGGKLTWKATALGSLGIAEVSGRYRIEGMEGSGDYKTSFYPVLGAVPTDFTVEEKALPDFDSTWPLLSKLLHPDATSASKGLRIDALNAGDLALEKLETAPPLASFEKFIIFVKALSAQASLRITVDSGAGTTPALTLEVPLSLLQGGWKRIAFAYGGDGTITVRDGEGGQELSFAAARGAYDAFHLGGSRLRIEALQLAQGDSVQLDELLLEAPRGDSSLAFWAEAAYLDREAGVTIAGLSLLKGIDLGLDSSGSLAAAPFLNGGLDAATRLGPFSIKAGLHGLLSDATPSYRANHRLAFDPAGFPLVLSDNFSLNPANLGFARGNLLSLDAGNIGRISLESSTEKLGDLAASGLGGLTQTWKGRLGLASFAFIESEAVERSSPGPSLPGDYFGAWTQAYSFLLPRGGQATTARSLSAKAALGLGGGKELLTSSLGFDARVGAVTDRGDGFSLKLAPPLPTVAGIRFSPYYTRVWSDRRPGSDAALYDFASADFARLSSMSLVWQALPFGEFYGSATHDALVSVFGAGGLSELSYIPELGLAVSRDPGSTVLDLLLPSGLLLSWKREISTKGVDFRDVGTFTGKLDFAALDIFGSNGRTPRFVRYASDEYRLSFGGGFDLPAGASVSAWNLSNQTMVSLFGDQRNPGEKLLVDNRSAFASAASGLTWSEKLGLVLSRQRERTFLLDFYRFLALNVAKPLAPKGGGIASSYLGILAELEPKARSILSIDAEIKGGKQDAGAPPPDLSFTESWETRITVPERLSLWVKASFAQARTGTTGDIALSLEASLGATFSF
jgi:hypothetical protein